MFGASHLSWSYVALFAADASYFVRASCTATAHATEMINQRHASRRALMFGASHLTGLSVACAYFVSASCTATAHATEMLNQRHASRRALMFGASHLTGLSVACAYFVSASCTATAHATEAPTMGLLPMPMRPIISTCAGTEEEPANCASECILPMVSVMP